ncbi:hypothetical protein AB0K48_45290 [Nonomuraea sp. NPDC055795]
MRQTWIRWVAAGVGLLAVGACTTGAPAQAGLPGPQVKERLLSPAGVILPLPERLPNGYVVGSAASRPGKDGKAAAREIDFVPAGQDPARSLVSICAEPASHRDWPYCGAFDSAGGTFRREVGAVKVVIRIEETDPQTAKVWAAIALTGDYNRVGWLQD